MEGKEVRRTLSEQLSFVDSSNLRDLLKLRDDDEARPSRRGSITLASVMATEKLESAGASVGSSGSGRTLLDIMQQEHEMSGRVVDGSSSSGINMEDSKDHILFHQIATTWPDAATAIPNRPDHFSDAEVVVSSKPIPTALLCSVPTEPPEQVPTYPSDSGATATEQNAPASAVVSARNEPSANRREVAVESNSASRSHLDAASLARAPAAVVEEHQSPRISLMELLEQIDGHLGSSLSVCTGVKTEDEINDDAAENSGIKMIYVCCVCMVRHKGAAFIPCGHTFCRLCSRELWMNRGNCPLCNRHILEILDIF